MAKGYIPVNRDQQFLFPPDMREWLGKDHFVWWLLDVVARLDTKELHKLRRRGAQGRTGYDRDMMLALLLYAYTHKVRSSREIERLCQTDVAFRVICAGNAPDHSTIARFRQDQAALCEKLFAQVLELCAWPGWPGGGGGPRRDQGGRQRLQGGQLRPGPARGPESKIRGRNTGDVCPSPSGRQRRGRALRASGVTSCPPAWPVPPPAERPWTRPWPPWPSTKPVNARASPRSGGPGPGATSRPCPPPGRRGRPTKPPSAPQAGCPATHKANKWPV